MPYCITCSRAVGSKGVAMHRAAHRRRQERVVIRLARGTFEYDYRPEPAPALEPRVYQPTDPEVLAEVERRRSRGLPTLDPEFWTPGMLEAVKPTPATVELNERVYVARLLTDDVPGCCGPDGTCHLDAIMDRLEPAPRPEPEPFSIGDTCCGKCPGGTCYVDQITGA